MSRILVLAWGNPSRGDDALGPLFAQRAEALVAGTPHAFEFAIDFQLSPEHAADLLDRDAVLFVDASVAGPPPFRFGPVAAAHDRTFTSHAMSPAAILSTYSDAFGREPPPAFVLAIRGSRFELGEPPGADANRHLDAALAFFARLAAARSPGDWVAMAAHRA